MSIPLLNDEILPSLQDKSIITPFSRWTIGRKSNPNFLTAGSGFEGHLCAFTPPEIASVLDDLQNEAFHIIKNDVGLTKLTTFLEDQSKPVGIKLVTSARIAFEIALARARAMRGMIERGGYYYTKDNQYKKVDDARRTRSSQYGAFIYGAPAIIDWQLAKVDVGAVSLEQKIESTLPLPIPVEFLGADIGTNNKHKLLAELGRFGHPMVPLILRSYK